MGEPKETCRESTCHRQTKPVSITAHKRSAKQHPTMHSYKLILILVNTDIFIIDENSIILVTFGHGEIGGAGGGRQSMQ